MFFLFPIATPELLEGYALNYYVQKGMKRYEALKAILNYRSLKNILTYVRGHEPQGDSQGRPYLFYDSW